MKTANMEAGRFLGLLKKLCIEYFKGVDALVRILAAYIYVAFMFGGLWLLIQLVVRLPFGQEAAASVFACLALLFTPLIIRQGFLGCGFEIPPIFGKRKSTSK